MEAQGIELKRHGADLLALPRQLPDWVMKSRGVSFRHAVELLRNEHLSLSAPARIVSKGTRLSALRLGDLAGSVGQDGDVRVRRIGRSDADRYFSSAQGRFTARAGRAAYGYG